MVFADSWTTLTSTSSGSFDPSSRSKTPLGLRCSSCANAWSFHARVINFTSRSRRFPCCSATVRPPLPSLVRGSRAARQCAHPCRLNCSHHLHFCATVCCRRRLLESGWASAPACCKLLEYRGETTDGER